jgi:glycosyltransferase involved in cell wall biosynthesis
MPSLMSLPLPAEAATPALHPFELSIVIPAFNEAENLEQVFAQMVDRLNLTSLKNRYELIFVNDGSTDETGRLIDKLASEYSFVTALHHTKNQGMGASLVTGFRKTQGHYVTLLPADGEISVDNVIRFHKAIHKADLLVSSRECPDVAIQREVRPLSRQILSWGNRTLMRMILGFDPKGMEGIFMIKGDILREISFKSQSGLVILEIIFQCHKAKRTICKDVMVYQPRLGGQSKVTNARMILKTFLDILKLRLSCV